MKLPDEVHPQCECVPGKPKDAQHDEPCPLQLLEPGPCRYQCKHGFVCGGLGLVIHKHMITGEVGPAGMVDYRHENCSWALRDKRWGRGPEEVVNEFVSRLCLYQCEHLFFCRFSGSDPHEKHSSGSSNHDLCKWSLAKPRLDPVVATDDPVSHPTHYNIGRFEVIDVLEDWKLGFHLGNAVKYIARAGRKDPGKTIEDLEKARWYLDRHIQMLKKEKEGA